MAHHKHGTVAFGDVYEQGLEGSRSGTSPGPDRDAEMAALVGDRWTYEAIGRVYGLSRSIVHKNVRRHLESLGR